MLLVVDGHMPIQSVDDTNFVKGKTKIILNISVPSVGIVFTLPSFIAFVHIDKFPEPIWLYQDYSNHLISSVVANLVIKAPITRDRN
jgi:hypothetical protein